MPRPKGKRYRHAETKLLELATVLPKDAMGHLMALIHSEIPSLLPADTPYAF